jgi:hypothetical protein
MADVEYHVDSNHLGVRVAVLIAMIGGFIGGILAIPALLRLLGIASALNIILVVGGAFGLAFGLSWLVEAVLREVWPSGRSLAVKADQIVLQEKEGEDVVLDWGAVDVWAWCFAVDDRRQWVPRGWYCCALRLAQGTQTISPYSFFKPADANALPGWEAFEELISEKYASRPGNEHLAAMVSGQIHLRTAEDERWRQGAEMKADDFVALLEVVQQRTGWPEQAVE